jgi:hypothetical protein
MDCEFIIILFCYPSNDRFYRTALVSALSSQKRVEETIEDVQMRLQRLAEEKAENELGELSTVMSLTSHTKVR